MRNMMPKTAIRYKGMPASSAFSKDEGRTTPTAPTIQDERPSIFWEFATVSLTLKLLNSATVGSTFGQRFGFAATLKLSTLIWSPTTRTSADGELKSIPKKMITARRNAPAVKPNSCKVPFWGETRLPEAKPERQGILPSGKGPAG